MYKLQMSCTWLAGESAADLASILSSTPDAGAPEWLTQPALECTVMEAVLVSVCWHEIQSTIKSFSLSLTARDVSRVLF